jgi:hypothetical protein
MICKPCLSFVRQALRFRLRAIDSHRFYFSRLEASTSVAPVIPRTSSMSEVPVVDFSVTDANIATPHRHRRHHSESEKKVRNARIARNLLKTMKEEKWKLRRLLNYLKCPCAGCKKSFKTKELLNQHLISHSGKCPWIYVEISFNFLFQFQTSDRFRAASVRKALNSKQHARVTNEEFMAYNFKTWRQHCTIDAPLNFFFRHFEIWTIKKLKYEFHMKLEN